MEVSEGKTKGGNILLSRLLNHQGNAIFSYSNTSNISHLALHYDDNGNGNDDEDDYDEFQREAVRTVVSSWCQSITFVNTQKFNVQYKDG